MVSVTCPCSTVLFVHAWVGLHAWDRHCSSVPRSFFSLKLKKMHACTTTIRIVPLGQGCILRRFSAQSGSCARNAIGRMPGDTRTRKDLSNECGVQWVLTKPRGSGASQARHHRKKQHPGAMALPTANLNGKGRKKRPKSEVKLTGKGKQNQKCTKKIIAYRGTEPGTARASSGSLSGSAKRLRLAT